MFKKKFLTMLALAVALPLSVSANPDDGLYDPVAPEGSAFFRYIHADPASEDLTIKANNKSYDTYTYKSVTKYYVMPEGEVDFAIGDKTLKQPLTADKYYTVIRTDEKVTVLEDKPLENTSKALVTFYNMTDHDDLALKTSEKKITVIEPVAAHANGAREVNAVKLSLVASEGDEVLGTYEPVLLERGNAYTFVAFENKDGDIELASVKSETDTTK